MMLKAEKQVNFNEIFFGLIREIHGNPAGSQTLGLVVDGMLVIGTLGLPEQEPGQKQAEAGRYWSDELPLKDVRLYLNSGGVATAESLIVRVASISAFSILEIIPPAR